MSDAYIKQIYDAENDQIIYPVTTTDALYDSGGQTVSELIDEIQNSVDETREMIGEEASSSGSHEETRIVGTFTYDFGPGYVIENVVISIPTATYDGVFTVTYNGETLPPSLWELSYDYLITVHCPNGSFVDGDTVEVYETISHPHGSSSAAHSIGEIIRIGDTEYKVIADIAVGDYFVVGTNIEETTVNDALMQMSNRIIKLQKTYSNAPSNSLIQVKWSESELASAGIDYSDWSKYSILQVNQSDNNGSYLHLCSPGVIVSNNMALPYAETTLSGTSRFRVYAYNLLSSPSDITVTVLILKH